MVITIFRRNEMRAIDMITAITLIKRDGDYFVSSKEVAKRFFKHHRNVLRDISELQISDNFRLLNFERGADMDSNGINRPIYLMTKDGFMMLAMGFTGKEATKWKENFICAFNKMADVIKNKLPMLEERVKQLESEKNTLLLESPKKPHHLKNTVMVPVSVNTLFGPDIEYHRVPRNSDRYSDLSYKEGELKRLSSCLGGMAKKIDYLTREVALLRRK